MFTKAVDGLQAALPTCGLLRARETRQKRLGQESGDFITSDVTTMSCPSGFVCPAS